MYFDGDSAQPLSCTRVSYKLFTSVVHGHEDKNYNTITRQYKLYYISLYKMNLQHICQHENSTLTTRFHRNKKKPIQ